MALTHIPSATAELRHRFVLEVFSPKRASFVKLRWVWLYASERIKFSHERLNIASLVFFLRLQS